MAGAEHLIVVPETLHPWPLVFEIAQVTEPGSWVLVGGLMVHVHAIRAGVAAHRATGDVDLLLNVGVSQLSQIVGPLQSIGFRPQPPPGAGPFHRFVREAGGESVEAVDVMVGSGVRARLQRRDVLQAPGANQALDRIDWYIVQGKTHDIRIAVPDALGAIVAKSAAYAVDRRDRDRHLEDIVVLLRAAGSIRALELDRLTVRDRKHLRPAFALLSDLHDRAWLQLPEADRTLAQRIGAAVGDEIAP